MISSGKNIRARAKLAGCVLSVFVGLAGAPVAVMAASHGSGPMGHPESSGGHHGAHYGHHAKTMRGMRLPQASLQAAASSQVAQDTVTVTLSAQMNDVSQQVVNAQLSKALDTAVASAKKQDAVKVYSGNFRVWPFTDEDGKVTRWQGRAELILESKDFPAASELAASLGDQLSITNIAFSVSPESRAKAEEALLEEAASAFRKRADAFAVAFGFQSYSIKELNLGGAGVEYAPAPRMMAMAADKASVPLEGNTETVTVSVQGTIYLQRENK
jgi:predicted secreted protein|tara:strand:- start:2129 stop:2944 length:816 start_codon:yes stop_codon:yes gene_type:complete